MALHGWLFLCVTTALFATGVALQPVAELRQVVVVSRHGVRGPYGLGTEVPSEKILKTYVRNPNLTLPLRAVEWGTSETDDPKEIVSPKITRHGYRLVQLMGKYFREHLYAQFLDDHCDASFAYADANQRDNRTAEAFLRGMYPECSHLAPTTNQTRLLFEQGQDPTATCPVCSRAVYEGIAGAKDTRYLIAEHRDKIRAVNDLLECCGPSICALNESDSQSPVPSSSDDGKCDFFHIPSKWKGAFYSPWRDSLSESEYFTEWLLLQALNNMSLPSMLSFERILELSKLHEVHMNLVTNQVNSANFGATLLAHITASLEEAVSGQPVPLPEGEGPRLLQPPRTKFLYYAGHDINLLYIRKLLRLQWYTKGWHPHQPTPGGMIVFELYSAHDGSKRCASGSSSEDCAYVKAFFMSASPQQMRNGETLSDNNPPERVPLVIPLCSEEVVDLRGDSELRCPFSKFKSLIGRTLKHECVADTLRPYVDSLTSELSIGKPNTGFDDDATSLRTVMWLSAAALGLAFVGFAGRHYHRSRVQMKHLQSVEYAPTDTEEIGDQKEHGRHDSAQQERGISAC